MYVAIGEDPPSYDEIDQFGLYHACQQTSGNFALYSGGEYAARGRVGTSPLYWNGSDTFSFYMSPSTPIEFPVGHLYDLKRNRLVCWDSMYFDKPLDRNDVTRLRTLLRRAVERLDLKTDAFVLGPDYGSSLIDRYVSSNKIAYMIVDDGVDEDDGDSIHVNSQNIIMVHTKDFPKWLSIQSEPPRRIMLSIGADEIFSADPDKFDPHLYTKLAEEYLKYGIEICSPFLDNDVFEYVLDMTTPSVRPELLEKLFDDEE